MKKTLFLLFIASFFVFSCKNRANENEENSSSDENEQILTEESISNLEKIERVTLEYLPKIIQEENEDFQKEFNMYLDAFNTKIESSKQLEAIFSMRDSLLRDLEAVMDNYYWEVGDLDWEHWEKIEEELDTIGFYSIYAEGMYVGLEAAPILSDEIEEFGSDEFKLYIDFKNTYALSMGGEYPYMSILPYFEVVAIGEVFYNKYQNSKYYELIVDDYMWSLMAVFDVHKVSFKGDEGSACFNGEMNYSYWPFVTDCDGWKTILEENPNSMFAPLIQNMINNTSEIEVDMDNEGKLAEVYVVATDKFDSYIDANYKVFDYLHQGLDIVHPIQLKKDGEPKTYVVYRFYSDYRTALASFDYINEIVANAQLFKVVLEEEFSAVITEDLTE